MKLFIKYMESIHSKIIVKSNLKKLGLHCQKISKGEVKIKEDINEEQRYNLKLALLKDGLLLIDKKEAIINKIKKVVNEIIHYTEELPKIDTASYISKKLNLNFKYLSTLFSHTTGITIEHYIITNKIERAKELMVYEDLSLDEVAHRLNYSSSSYLSQQFKKITGYSPTYFMHLDHEKFFTIR